MVTINPALLPYLPAGYVDANGNLTVSQADAETVATKVKQHVDALPSAEQPIFLATLQSQDATQALGLAPEGGALPADLDASLDRVSTAISLIAEFFASAEDVNALSKLLIKNADEQQKNALAQRLAAREEAKSDLSDQADKMRSSAKKLMTGAIAGLVVAVVGAAISIGMLGASMGTSAKAATGLSKLKVPEAPQPSPGPSGSSGGAGSLGGAGSPGAAAPEENAVPVAVATEVEPTTSLVQSGSPGGTGAPGEVGVVDHAPSAPPEAEVNALNGAHAGEETEVDVDAPSAGATGAASSAASAAAPVASGSAGGGGGGPGAGTGQQSGGAASTDGTSATDTNAASTGATGAASSAATATTPAASGSSGGGGGGSGAGQQTAGGAGPGSQPNDPSQTSEISPADKVRYEQEMKAHDHEVAKLNQINTKASGYATAGNTAASLSGAVANFITTETQADSKKTDADASEKGAEAENVKAQGDMAADAQNAATQTLAKMQEQIKEALAEKAESMNSVLRITG